MKTRTIPILIALAGAAYFGSSGCLSGRGFELGPYPIAVDLGDGVIRDQLVGLPIGIETTIEEEQDLCPVLVNVDVDQLVRDQVGDAVANRVTVSGLLLRELVLTATQGDFEDLHHGKLFFVPASEDGEPQLIGEVDSEDGFGLEITVSIQGDFDLLPIIEEVQANPGGPCPSVRLELRGLWPDDKIEYMSTGMVDVFLIAGL
ncbi:MAG: hypothetical protein AAB353_11100 [Candidatus Hydrogenedentota bacterium]